MRNIFKSRIVAATVIAVGLGVAGTGAATAATGHLPWDSVGTHQVRNNSIRSFDIHDGSVRAHDLSQWVQKQLSQAGTPGVDGTDGTDGTNGVDGVSGYKGNAVTSTVPFVTADTLQSVSVECPSGLVPLGGGFNTNATGVDVVGSMPGWNDDYSAMNGWDVTLFNTSGHDVKVAAFVTCAAVN